jgi:hypothetical protein
MEGVIGRVTPPPLNHPGFFCGFVSAAWAWQVLFLFLASDPMRYRPMMLPSILEKISYGKALIVLHQQQRVPESTFRIGMADWIFAGVIHRQLPSYATISQPQAAVVGALPCVLRPGLFAIKPMSLLSKIAIVLTPCA